MEVSESLELLRIAREMLAEDYDLKGKYDFWNRKAFGGELPRVPLGWIRSKKVGGQVSASAKITDPVTYRITGKADITVKKLVLSNFLVGAEDRLDALMLHEMIHVYVLGVLGINERPGGHGPNFQAMRKEIQSKTGIKIPVTEDITGLEVSPEVRTRPFGVVLAKRGGKLLMQMLNLNSFRRLKGEILSYMLDNDYLFPWARLLITDERELLKHTEQRKFGRRWSVIDRDLWEKLLESGKVVGVIG